MVNVEEATCNTKHLRTWFASKSRCHERLETTIISSRQTGDHTVRLVASHLEVVAIWRLGDRIFRTLIDAKSLQLLVSHAGADGVARHALLVMALHGVAVGRTPELVSEYRYTAQGYKTEFLRYS